MRWSPRAASATSSRTGSWAWTISSTPSGESLPEESALDPEIVAALLATAAQNDPLAVLTPREREVLSLVAEGQSNAAVAGRLYLAERTVETHMRSIFQKLRIPETGDAHRRVLAVLAYLSHTTHPQA